MRNMHVRQCGLKLPVVCITTVDNSDVRRQPSPQSPPPPPVPPSLQRSGVSGAALELCYPPESTCEEDCLSVWGISSAGPPVITQQFGLKN